MSQKAAGCLAQHVHVAFHLSRVGEIPWRLHTKVRRFHLSWRGCWGSLLQRHGSTPSRAAGRRSSSPWAGSLSPRRSPRAGWVASGCTATAAPATPAPGTTGAGRRTTRTRRHRLGDSQDQARDEPAAVPAGEKLERAAVGARDALDDRQAEAGAAGTGARGIEAGERTLQPVGFGLGDSRAAVQNLNDDLIPGLAAPDVDRLARIAQGIVDQVGDRAAHRYPGKAEGRNRLVPERDLLSEAGHRGRVDPPVPPPARC